mmetsp:Transcript_54490/g.127289  ORF Transcript_54490/g.127289 Transcript_54490/m.127289 type:complete len:201 (-) Transcript_54490:213-815(-)
MIVILIPLPLTHRVGRVSLFLRSILLSSRIQILTSLLIHLPDRQVQLGAGNADDLHYHLIVSLHPVCCSSNHTGFLGELRQVTQAFLRPFSRIQGNEGAILHDSSHLSFVDPKLLHRRSFGKVSLRWLLGAATSTALFCLLLRRLLGFLWRRIFARHLFTFLCRRLRNNLLLLSWLHLRDESMQALCKCSSGAGTTFLEL